MKRIYAYAGLLKFRLSAAVTFSAVTGFLLYDNNPGPEIIFMIAGVFLLSSGAAALNQYTERDPDGMMDRTKHRPIPGDLIGSRQAVVFAVILLIAGSAVLSFSGITPVILGALTVFLYNAVYTALKRISYFAVVPGALVGAIPPVIGFTAAGAASPDAGIILFASFMFLWQLPHFWLIILRHRSDYARAGFKTFPAGIDENITKVLVFAWVSVTSLLLVFFSLKELVFDSIISMILIPMNAGFILLFYRFLFITGEKRGERIAFILINVFSLAVMLLFIANSFLV
jgi:protoheme IX farnesyltransferase